MTPHDLLLSRERTGMTRRDAAIALDVSEATLWRYEMGRTAPHPTWVDAAMRLYGTADVCPAIEVDDE